MTNGVRCACISDTLSELLLACEQHAALCTMSITQTREGAFEIHLCAAARCQMHCHHIKASFEQTASDTHLGGALGREEPEAAGGGRPLADLEVGGVPSVARALFISLAAAGLCVAKQGAPGARARAQDAAKSSRVVVGVVEAADCAVGAVGVHLAECVQRVRAVQQLHHRVKQRRRRRAQLGRLHTATPTQCLVDGYTAHCTMGQDSSHVGQ